MDKYDNKLKVNAERALYLYKLTNKGAVIANSNPIVTDYST